jgi:hypothetical protein
LTASGRLRWLGGWGAIRALAEWASQHVIPAVPHWLSRQFADWDAGVLVVWTMLGMIPGLLFLMAGLLALLVGLPITVSIELAGIVVRYWRRVTAGKKVTGP